MKTITEKLKIEAVPPKPLAEIDISKYDDKDDEVEDKNSEDRYSFIRFSSSKIIMRMIFFFCSDESDDESDDEEELMRELEKIKRERQEEEERKAREQERESKEDVAAILSGNPIFSHTGNSTVKRR